jgi:hypothetical protein
VGSSPRSCGVDWAFFDAVCAFLADDVSSLEVPRQNPWGKSVSVNSLVIADMPGRDENTLEIEMQSGDVIWLYAKRIAMQE